MSSLPIARAQAKTLVTRNGYERYIEVIQGKVEDIDIPEKVDVVIRSAAANLVVCVCVRVFAYLGLQMYAGLNACV